MNIIYKYIFIIATIQIIYINNLYSSEISGSNYKFISDIVNIIESINYVICDNCEKQNGVVYGDNADKRIVNVPLKINISNNTTSKDNKYIKNKSTRTIHFRFGKYNFNSKYKNILDEIINKYNNDDSYLIDIVGFTDSKGSKAINNKIEIIRAKTVASYLRKNGLIIRNISGKGKCCYISKSKNKLNRRVEVIITKQKGDINDKV